MNIKPSLNRNDNGHERTMCSWEWREKFLAIRGYSDYSETAFYVRPRSNHSVGERTKDTADVIGTVSNRTCGVNGKDETASCRAWGKSVGRGLASERTNIVVRVRMVNCYEYESEVRGRSTSDGRASITRWKTSRTEVARQTRVVVCIKVDADRGRSRSRRRPRLCGQLDRLLWTLANETLERFLPDILFTVEFTIICTSYRCLSCMAIIVCGAALVVRPRGLG